MTNSVGLPASPSVAKKVLDDRHKERGMLGSFFGGKEHAPTNIAAMALLLLILLLVGLIFAPLSADVERSSLITAVLSAVTFTLGLIFGRSSNGQ